MKRTFAATVVCVALALLWGCDCRTERVTWPTAVGSGILVTESRPVQGFTGVVVSGAGRVVIEQTGIESLQVTAEDDVMPFVSTEVRGGRLFLGFEPGVSVSPTRGVEYRVSVAELTEIEATGASRVEILHVDTPELTTRLVGASIYTAAGIATDHSLELIGASRCDAADLASHTVTAHLSGASYGLVRARDRLVVRASGASTLEYFGNPVVDVRVSGASVVRPRG
jgi:hypothetical protein